MCFFVFPVVLINTQISLSKRICQRNSFLPTVAPISTLIFANSAEHLHDIPKSWAKTKSQPIQHVCLRESMTSTSTKVSAFQFNSIIVREPARSVINGLRAVDHGNPTYEGVLSEHKAYVAAMKDAGVEVTVLPADEEFPDSIFVEDPALVFPEGAVVLRPGHPTRLNETKKLGRYLETRFEKVLYLSGEGGGNVDGGDVLTTSKKVMIGLSARTNETGAKQLQKLLLELGRQSEIVRTPPGVLHFKSDCSLLDDDTVFSTKRLAESGVFRDVFSRIIIVPEGEEAGANALRVNDRVFVGEAFPESIALLRENGFTVVPMKTREIGLIDAGLSCMSLRWFDLEKASLFPFSFLSAHLALLLLISVFFSALRAFSAPNDDHQ